MFYSISVNHINGYILAYHPLRETRLSFFSPVVTCQLFSKFESTAAYSKPQKEFSVNYIGADFLALAVDLERV